MVHLSIDKKLRTLFFYLGALTFAHSLFGQSPSSKSEPKDSKKSTPAPKVGDQTDPTVEASVEKDDQAQSVFVYLKKGPNTKFNFLGPWSLQLPKEVAVQGFGQGATINKKPNTTTDDPKAMPLFNVEKERYELKPVQYSGLKGKELEFNLKYFFCRSDGGLCKINKKTLKIKI